MLTLGVRVFTYGKRLGCGRAVPVEGDLLHGVPLGFSLPAEPVRDGASIPRATGLERGPLQLSKSGVANLQAMWLPDAVGEEELYLVVFLGHASCCKPWLTQTL